MTARVRRISGRLHLIGMAPLGVAVSSRGARDLRLDLGEPMPGFQDLGGDFPQEDTIAAKMWSDLLPRVRGNLTSERFRPRGGRDVSPDGAVRVAIEPETDLRAGRRAS
jgi:hypothetical protein